MPWHDTRVADSRVIVSVEAPGQIEPTAVELERGTGVVLGRAPEPTRVEGELGGSATVTSRTVAVASVSSNHAAVWLTDDALHVRDLGSRNGTWVRLPPRQTVSLPVGDAHVRLATGAATSSGDDDLPESARFHGAADYPAGIVHAVRSWLQHHDIRASVWVEDQPRTASNPGAVSVQLAAGGTLVAQSDGTIDETFQGLLSRIARYVAAQNALYAAEQETRDDGMILASSAIRQVHRRVVELASQGVPRIVLIGPSGTGKERLARSYHRHAAEDRPLVAINCASLGRDRLIADLFGAEAGAYTGAQKTMIGAVERADGGTLFLDEIGEMPLEVQPQLLRFLDLGEYQRLGSIGVTRTANVKVVAATNRDLRRMVADGMFRADLFFRLALEVIEIPPLRLRFADVVAYLETQTLGGTSARAALTPDAMDLLRAHRWDGNFRELVNFVRRLPRTAAPESLDAPAVQRALEAGALIPVPDASQASTPSSGWAECVRASVTAFQAAALPEPTSWSDVVQFIEQYLKPHALVHLAGVTEAPNIDSVAVGRVAERVKADRGTVLKQLRRYFETFRRT
jgi:DNA-binding NtrC family response regulator